MHRDDLSFRERMKLATHMIRQLISNHGWPKDNMKENSKLYLPRQKLLTPLNYKITQKFFSSIPICLP